MHLIKFHSMCCDFVAFIQKNHINILLFSILLRKILAFFDNEKQGNKVYKLSHFIAATKVNIQTLECNASQEHHHI